MRNISGLLFAGGLAFLLLVLAAHLPYGQTPMTLGNAILAHAPGEVHTANIVAAVLLAYRGIDTLGELSILFTAAAGVGLILGHSSLRAKNSEPSVQAESGFITTRAVDLLMPLLIVVGFYIIFYGHVTPGGGFQGGVILAIAFFLPVMVRPGNRLDHGLITFLEGLAGGGFIVVGLWALLYDKPFLQPIFDSFLGTGPLGSLWSAGTLPLLYLAVGLKVGAELAGLLLAVYEVPDLCAPESSATNETNPQINKK